MWLSTFCCSKALHLPEVQDGVSSEWAIEAVTVLYYLVKNGRCNVSYWENDRLLFKYCLVYPIKLPKLKVNRSTSSEDTGSYFLHEWIQLFCSN